MVTATPTRPATDATSGRCSARPEGVFARPEALSARAAGARRQHRSRRPRRRVSKWLSSLVDLLRLPPPLVDRSRPPAQTELDTAAAIGVWMRRRDDPNP